MSVGLDRHRERELAGLCGRARRPAPGPPASAGRCPGRGRGGWPALPRHRLRSSVSDLLGRRGVVERGRGEIELDGQGDQVLLGPVVQVAFQAPPRLVLRGDQALPGRPEILDQPGVGQDQAACDARSVTRCSPAGRSGSDLGIRIEIAPSRRPWCSDGDAEVSAGQGGQRAAVDRSAAGRRRWPSADDAAACSSSSTRSQMTDLLGTGPIGHGVRHLGQHIVAGVRAAHAPAEIGQHLIRGRPPPVHDPVRQPPGPAAERLEGDRHDRGGQGGQQRAAPVADQGSHPDDQTRHRRR